MPSHRRQRSRSESRSRSRDRSRSRSPGTVHLPNDAAPISESDYFLKSDEFRVWLREEKRKYLDELTSDKARKYFRKFVKAWNRGRLPKSLYSGVEAQTASSQTAYRWSFASKASKTDSEAVRTARAEVDSATWNRSRGAEAGPSSGPRRMLGPTLPSQSDITLTREAAEENHKAERDYKRKRDRKEAKDRIEDMVGPREVGKEGMLEKKRAKRDADKSFREKGEDGLEADETTLMGSGGGFREAIARRDAGRRKHEERQAEKMSAVRERTEAIRQKDQQTMAMFMQMAKEKFG
ncbi:hypothetical protein QCA50_002435 [Cerrena zonata]|uniref:Uncharacterized protein n=1 Tax=Cerrena zonata TaxID=2478898 RepID=A0AAW0GYY7_9APHY